jgi:Zn-dependent protease
MDFAPIIIQIFVIFFAITIHEAAHGWAAMKMGDSTAYAAGRVTLNPLAHVDLIGTIIVPLVLILANQFFHAHQPIFGWAKPVPVNPYNLRRPRRDYLWVSFAGPIANLATAASALFLIRLRALLPSGVTSASFMIKPINGLILLLIYTALINTFLAVFNLIPLPPLDGSGILAGLLSESAAAKYDRLRPYSFIIILALVYTNVLTLIFSPIQKLIEHLIR